MGVIKHEIASQMCVSPCQLINQENVIINQIPTSSLSFGRSRPGFSSEVAIVVKHKSKGTQSEFLFIVLT